MPLCGPKLSLLGCVLSAWGVAQLVRNLDDVSHNVDVSLIYNFHITLIQKCLSTQRLGIASGVSSALYV